MRITIDSVTQCRTDAIGRQVIAPTDYNPNTGLDTIRADYARPADAGPYWSQLFGLGSQSGPVIVATVYDDDGDPRDRLVVAGRRDNREVIEAIRGYVAQFPDARIADWTGIIAP